MLKVESQKLRKDILSNIQNNEKESKYIIYRYKRNKEKKAINPIILIISAPIIISA